MIGIFITRLNIFFLVIYYSANLSGDRLGGPMANLTFRAELVRFGPINDFHDALPDAGIGSPIISS